jgi:RNA polymerase sigma factor (sigma-70 family)
MSDPVETSASSPSGFDRLLAALGSDRERAAEGLVLLRRKLLMYFTWNRAAFADELVDETLDRVARRLQEGDAIRSGDVRAYVYGFARNVLRESWSRPHLVQTRQDPVAPETMEVEQDVAERRSRCLDTCLARLPAETRRRLLAYYQADHGAAKILSRRELAARLGVSAGSLRLKLHRVRADLQVCVRACLAAAAETERSPAHSNSRGRSQR